MQVRAMAAPKTVQPSEPLAMAAVTASGPMLRWVDWASPCTPR
ncbi:hypothetical protein AB0M61_45270 [Streptomyces sp. NPDC051642]